MWQTVQNHGDMSGEKLYGTLPDFHSHIEISDAIVTRLSSVLGGGYNKISQPKKVGFGNDEFPVGNQKNLAGCRERVDPRNNLPPKKKYTKKKESHYGSMGLVYIYPHVP